MHDGKLKPSDVRQAQQYIARLCKLQAEVSEAIDPAAHRPADCFCGESGYWPLLRVENYRNDGHAIDFIENAVREAIDVYQEKHSVRV